MTELVTTEVRDAVACITLDRPPANAFDLALSRELGEAVRGAGERDDVGAIVITGGRRLFAAGADLRDLAHATPAQATPQVDALGGVCDLLEAVPKVTLAAINGYALGGGLEVALACDLRVVAQDAQLGQPEIRLGVIPGAGGTQRLVPVVGLGRAKELVYTGRSVDAAEALRIGLADRVVAPDDVLDASLAMARTFAAGPRHALAAAKHALRAAVLTPGPEGIAEERALFLQLFATTDQAEGMAAFLEKRPPVFGADA